MKLTGAQYEELKEKLASEAIDGMMKEAAEGEGVANEEKEQLTDEQIQAILAAKKQEVAQGSREEKEAEEADVMIQKAAAVYEYAMRKIAACEEMHADGVIGQQACIEVLAEVGMYDENGFNKEAAEESEETVNFANKIGESYDDSTSKVAAAEECYAEAVNEANAALEVLAGFGYEVE